MISGYEETGIVSWISAKSSSRAAAEGLLSVVKFAFCRIHSDKRSATSLIEISNLKWILLRFEMGKNLQVFADKSKMDSVYVTFTVYILPDRHIYTHIDHKNIRLRSRKILHFFFEMSERGHLITYRNNVCCLPLIQKLQFGYKVK